MNIKTIGTLLLTVMMLIVFNLAPDTASIANAQKPTRTPRPQTLSRAALAKLCSSAPQAIPSAPPFNGGAGIHQGILLREGGKGAHPYNNQAGLKGLVSTRSPELALCISEPVYRTDSNCYYLRDDNGRLIPVFGIDVTTGKPQLGEFPEITIRVIVVQTAQQIDQFTIQGLYTSTDPAFCDGKNGKPARADKITPQQVVERIRPLLNRQ